MKALWGAERFCMKITCMLPTQEKLFQNALVVTSEIAEEWKKLPPKIKDLVEWSGIKVLNETYDEFEVETKLSIPHDGIPNTVIVLKFHFYMLEESGRVAGLFTAQLLREIGLYSRKHMEASHQLARLCS